MFVNGALDWCGGHLVSSELDFLIRLPGITGGVEEDKIDRVRFE